MIGMPAKAVVASMILLCMLLGVAHATDPLPPQTRLAAAPGAPTSTKSTFNIPAAQDLVVTLTDLKIPAALVSASVVVTQGAAIAATAQLAAPATSATASLAAANGDYTLYVFGVPDAAFSVGTFTVCVAPKDNPSNCIQSASLSGNITAKGTANDPTVSTYSSPPLTVTAQGNYTFTFNDFQFPVALNTPPSLALFQGSTPIQTGITSGQTLNLSPGAYTLLAIAQADQSIKAGLFGITISAPGTAALLDTAVAVGLTATPEPFNNSTDQSLTLKVTDYGFPGPLASASALLTAGGTALGTASAAGGAMSFAAPAGSLTLWTYARAGATPGTFSADVSAAGAELFTTAQGVQLSGPTYAYAFVVSPPLTPGPYRATAADLQFPSQLDGLSFAVAQNGAILQQSATAASIDFNASAGNVILLVSAQTPASNSVSGNGLFGINVQTTGASAQLVYDKTQGVSSTAALFDSQPLNLGVSASFDVTLTDLKFPATFDNLALVISRGTEILGKIYGGGPFSFPGSPGNYQLTFIATPAAQQQFGLYGVSIKYSVPVVTLTSNVATAVTDSPVTLSWTAANAASCTASGGNWTGDKAASSGTESVVLSATATYTLSCSGTGGVTAQSVSVTATAKPSSSGGGGGAVDLILLILGSACLGARLHRGRVETRPRKGGVAER